MNATINKIVSLLFEDLVETEETTAIRDEILQNCQERYQDLRDAGIGEDDAIHAVIESLNGMEEMLSAYPRKDERPAQKAEADEEEDLEQAGEWTCDPSLSPIREIRLNHMGSASVQVESSCDSLIHVECDNTDLGLLTAISGGVLTIGLSESSDPNIKFSADLEFDLKSLGRLFDKLCRRFTAVRSSAYLTVSIPDGLRPALYINTSSGCVEMEPMTLEQLSIGTASGDITLGAVQVSSEVRLTSASGDITVDNVNARHLHLSSASGDLEADHSTVEEDVRLNTTSGDITWYSDCKTMEASSISGDMELEGMAETVSFKTVSGDISVTLRGRQLRSVNGKTTSGDVEVCLPEGTQADVRCSAVSGDIYNHAGSIPGAPVAVTLSTVAGDIEVN